MQLEWVDHSVQLLEGVSDLLKASKLVDVTITAEGKKIRAHRLILSAASTYFRVRCQTISLIVRTNRPKAGLNRLKPGEIGNILDTIEWLKQILNRGP